MKTRRENEAVFSKIDMLCFGRYLTDGRISESTLSSRFRTWSDGPKKKRFKWIVEKD